jgi:hypothetical protein
MVGVNAQRITGRHPVGFFITGSKRKGLSFDSSFTVIIHIDDRRLMITGQYDTKLSVAPASSMPDILR